MNIPFVVGVGFSMFCTWMLLYSLRRYKKSLASINWPTAQGVILEVRLWGKRNVRGEMLDLEKLSIKYSYAVQETAYQGTTPAFYTLVYPETVDFANNHPENSKIKVYYRPENPAESVLIPGPRQGNKRFSDILVAGLGLMIAAIIALLGALGILG
ncbi:MAG: DUF3592 domain-containing protein [Bacteroidota bacterium]